MVASQAQRCCALKASRGGALDAKGCPLATLGKVPVCVCQNTCVYIWLHEVLAEWHAGSFDCALWDLVPQQELNPDPLP